MTIDAILRSVSGLLRAANVPFMLTGSIAAAMYGHGRATMDLDIVIAPTTPQLDHFLELVTATGAYVSADAARDALMHGTMFNVVDPESGWKVDLIIRKNRSFSEVEFERRVETDMFGLTVQVASIEDVILSKLEWAKLGGSARQLDDVRALLHLQRDALDLAYIQRWIQALGLHAQWADVTDATSTNTGKPL